MDWQSWWLASPATLVTEPAPIGCQIDAFKWQGTSLDACIDRFVSMNPMCPMTNPLRYAAMRVGPSMHAWLSLLRHRCQCSRPFKLTPIARLCKGCWAQRSNSKSAATCTKASWASPVGFTPKYRTAMPKASSPNSSMATWLSGTLTKIW